MCRPSPRLVCRKWTIVCGSRSRCRAQRPAEIVKKLNADINKVVADTQYQDALKVRGFEAKGSTSDELAAFMEKDYLKNRDLILRLGLHVD